MSVIPEKRDYKNMPDGAAEQLAEKLKSCGYELVSRVRATEKSHFDRLGFVKAKKRVVVVYDVKANILSVTAFEEQFNEICSYCDKLRVRQEKQSKTDKSDLKHEPKPVKADKSVPKNKSQAMHGGTNVQSAQKAEKPVQQQKSDEKTAQKQQKVNAKSKKNGQQAQKSVQPEQKTARKKIAAQPVQPEKQSAKENKSQSKSQAEVKEQKSESKNDFTLKKYDSERFDASIDSLKRSKVKVKLKSTQGAGTETVAIYELSDGDGKLTVRFMPHKKILQIQGKSNDFQRKVQTLFSEGGDFKSAVNAHIEQKQTDQRAADVEKLLKKHLPTGVLYLSSQAKIDFSIGVVDLLSGEIVLSDYSSLLIPPYRGLETLIFDLQRAQNVHVKMIGQAFEKNDDGEYVLKANFRRKIGSVVFAEVMAALYTEYNSTRNYYVHSAIGPQSKVIADKNQAIAIYERMLKVVEYNAKKLKEIGFSLGN